MNARYVSFLESAVEACLLAALATSAFAFDLQGYLPMLLKGLLIQTLAGAALLAAVLLVLETGRLELPLPRLSFAAGSGALAVWLIVSNLGQPYREAAQAEASRQVLQALAFLAVLLVSGGRGFARRLGAAVLAVAGVSAAYGLAQRMGFDFMPWKGLFSGDAFAFMENPDALAVLCAAALPFAALRAMAPQGGLGRGAAVLAGLLCAVALGATHSWAGVLGLIPAALLLNTAASAKRAPRVLRRGALVLFATGAALFSWAALRPGWEPAFEAWDARRITYVVERRQIAMEAMPWGIGPGRLGVPLDASHGTVWEPWGVPAEWGLPGVFFGLALFLLLVVATVRAYRRFLEEDDAEGAFLLAGQAAAFAAAVLATRLSGTASSTLPFLAALCAGSLAALATEAGASRVLALPLPLPLPARRAAAGLAAIAVLLLGVSTVRRHLGGNRHLLQAMGHLQDGDDRHALENFAKIPDAHPFGPFARFHEGEVYRKSTTKGDDVKALEAYAKAGALWPDYREVDLRTAQILHAQGDWKEAAPRYEAALKKRPYRLDAALGLAEVATILRDNEKARWGAAIAASLEPNEPEHWRRLAATYRDLGRPLAYRAMLRKAGALKEATASRPH